MKNTGESFEWKGILITTILMTIGSITIYFTWGNMDFNISNLYKYVFTFGVELIFSLLFIGIGIYCWFIFFSNKIIKPKEKIMYLKSIDEIENECILNFIDSKGKCLMKTIDKEDIEKYQVYSFYNVLRTRDLIHDILERNYEYDEIPTEKKSYWLNLYTPAGDFENILLLPIIYMFLIISVLSIIISRGLNKIFWIGFAILPFYLIIYDIQEKSKRH